MRVFVAVLFSTTVLGAAPAWAQAPVGAGKVFSSAEGERVSVVPLTPLESGKALLYVEGTGSEFDGKVLPHGVERRREDVFYTTQWKGRSYTTLYGKQTGGRRVYHLAVPGRQDDIDVSFDERRTEALKPESLYTLHQKQQADGTLTQLMAFDRQDEQAAQERAFAEPLESLNKTCGTSIKATIAWDTVSDEVLKRYSISSYCSNPLSALERLCTSEEVKKAIGEQVSQVSCEFGSALKLELQAGRLSWTTATEAANQEEFATGYLEQNLAPPGGQGKSLAEWLRWERTSVCTDGEGHYVVVAPHENKLVELSYGDGSRFVQVPTPPFGLSGYHFLEPRFFRKGSNPNFRGHDMRVYSEVELDVEKQSCAVRCGERTTALKLLARDKVRELLQNATFGPNPQEYVPYALLRDQQGRYYLVDRGARQDNEKSFRVFIGLKGALKQHEMVDLVSDSEGEIFSTKKGDLRLVVDRKAPSAWIEKAKKVELRPVPVEENLPLIYNELGVYTGARLGTPCDDQ